MCDEHKKYMYIEINNIELNPKFYFKELRIALCLECSKLFESYRNNENIRRAFLSEIQNTYIGYEGRVCVPFRERKITFTGKHLREIQLILKMKSDKGYGES